MGEEGTVTAIDRGALSVQERELAAPGEILEAAQRDADALRAARAPLYRWMRIAEDTAQESVWGQQDGRRG